jgi:NADPH:quinone reductase-like Zn-dependent oxidoreductase
VTLTAWQALYEMAKLAPGETVLIHGAAGGVGHVAVQLAQLRGARVIGTGSRHIDFVRELGVDQAIDYSTTPFESVVRDVDVVLDTIGGDTQQRSWQALKPGGILISMIQAPDQATADAHGVRQGMVYSAPPIGATLAEVSRLVDAGKIKPHVSAVLPLTSVAHAHALVEGHHTAGKLVLDTTC